MVPTNRVQQFAVYFEQILRFRWCLAKVQSAFAGEFSLLLNLVYVLSAVPTHFTCAVSEAGADAPLWGTSAASLLPSKGFMLWGAYPCGQDTCNHRFS
jgi:hypothetical protein